jgi:hypothetical protein
MYRVNRQLANVGLQDHRMAVLLCGQYYDFAEERADQYLLMARAEVIAIRSGGEMRSKTIKNGWLFEPLAWKRNVSRGDGQICSDSCRSFPAGTYGLQP